MKTKSKMIFSRLALVAALFGIAMLGNLRSQASESVLSGSRVSNLESARRAGVDAIRVVDSKGVPLFGGDADGAADDGPSTEDDGNLVPAIYAWDPDVRFVYYRHVSKWM